MPGSSDNHKYIPLHTKPQIRPNKLWWQPLSIDIPSSYSTVTIVNSAESASGSEEIQDDFQMEDSSTTHKEIFNGDEGEDQTTTLIPPGSENYENLEYDSSTFAYDEEEYFNDNISTATEIIPTTTIIYDQDDEG